MNRLARTILVAVAALPLAANAQPAPPPEKAYVYATDYYEIKPTLTLSGFTDPVSASYIASQSPAELQALYVRGHYGITSGEIDAKFTGSTLTGYWIEDGTNAGLSIYCDQERGGTHSYGRFVMRFKQDRSSFTGMRSSCNEDPDSTGYEWTGKLLRRIDLPATAPNPGGR